jgi:hypothetical protein
VYCRYDAGTSGPFARDAASVTALDGVLSGVLWTQGAASLGASYRVETDGVTWQQGLLSQRVLSLRTGREPARSLVAYEGPPGSVLWMRTVAAPRDGCPDPHEARRYWTLDPGEAVTFAVVRTMDDQVFAVSALGEPKSSLWVQIDDGQRLSTGLQSSWTKKERLLELRPEGESGPIRASPLDDPDASSVVLAARGIALSASLAGTAYRITVQNASPGRVHVRGLLEARTAEPAFHGIDEIGLIPIVEETE